MADRQSIGASTADCPDAANAVLLANNLMMRLAAQNGAPTFTGSSRPPGVGGNNNPLQSDELDGAPHGGAAMSACNEAISPAMADKCRRGIERQLHTYCNLDTLAMDMASVCREHEDWRLIVSRSYPIVID